MQQNEQNKGTYPNKRHNKWRKKATSIAVATAVVVSGFGFSFAGGADKVAASASYLGYAFQEISNKSDGVMYSFDSYTNPAWYELKDGKYVENKMFYAREIELAVQDYNISLLSSSNDVQSKAKEKVSSLIVTFNKAPGIIPMVVGVNDTPTNSTFWNVAQPTTDYFGSKYNSYAAKYLGKFEDATYATDTDKPSYTLLLQEFQQLPQAQRDAVLKEIQKQLESKTPYVQDNKGNQITVSKQEQRAINPLTDVNDERNKLIKEAVDTKDWSKYDEFQAKQHPAWYTKVDGKMVKNKMYYVGALERDAKEYHNAKYNYDQEKMQQYEKAVYENLRELRKAPGLMPYIIGINGHQSDRDLWNVEAATNEWFNSPYNNPKVQSQGVFEDRYWFENPYLVENKLVPEIEKAIVASGNGDVHKKILEQAKKDSADKVTAEETAKYGTYDGLKTLHAQAIKDGDFKLFEKINKQLRPFDYAEDKDKNLVHNKWFYSKMIENAKTWMDKAGAEKNKERFENASAVMKYAIDKFNDAPGFSPIIFGVNDNAANQLKFGIKAFDQSYSLPNLDEKASAWYKELYMFESKEIYDKAKLAMGNGGWFTDIYDDIFGKDKTDDQLAKETYDKVLKELEELKNQREEYEQLKKELEELKKQQEENKANNSTPPVVEDEQTPPPTNEDGGQTPPPAVEDEEGGQTPPPVVEDEEQTPPPADEGEGEGQTPPPVDEETQP